MRTTAMYHKLTLMRSQMYLNVPIISRLKYPCAAGPFKWLNRFCIFSYHLNTRFCFPDAHGCSKSFPSCNWLISNFEWTDRCKCGLRNWTKEMKKITLFISQWWYTYLSEWINTTLSEGKGRTNIIKIPYKKHNIPFYLNTIQIEW